MNRLIIYPLIWLLYSLTSRPNFDKSKIDAEEARQIVTSASELTESVKTLSGHLTIQQTQIRQLRAVSRMLIGALLAVTIVVFLSVVTIIRQQNTAHETRQLADQTKQLADRTNALAACLNGWADAYQNRAIALTTVNNERQNASAAVLIQFGDILALGNIDPKDPKAITAVAKLAALLQDFVTKNNKYIQAQIDNPIDLVAAKLVC